jgi:uncharacterized protein YbdZ (MbtH family)
MSDDDSHIEHRVVLNHEEQYSIWPVDRDIPPGWREEGFVGPKQDCLAHIDEVWTDMRPLSLRLHMEEQKRREANGELDEPDVIDDEQEEEESLVSKLCRGEHPVELSVRPERTGSAVLNAIERGYVFVRFTDTRGGTELGLRLDRDASDLSAADYDAPAGTIRLVGDLTLDFVPVQCTAEIDLSTMAGHGHLAERTN